MNKTDEQVPCETIRVARDWKTYFRKYNDEADCGIFYEIYPGQAFSVARCPRYAREDQWLEVSNRIIACTSACADIPEPAAAIQAARDALEAEEQWRSVEDDCGLLRAIAKDKRLKALKLLTPSEQ